MNWLRRGGLAALALMVAGVVACDSGGGTEPQSGARVVATVTAGGSGLSGVTVALYSGGATPLASATTGGGGEATFTGLDGGTYEVEITVPEGYVVPSGEETRKSVMVAEGQAGTVSFALEPDASATVVEVHLTSSLTFSPAELTIEPGTTVRWVNDASIFHTITPNGHSEWDDTSVSSAGETFTHTFETEGEFPYYCSPHRSQGMTGTITVQASQADR